MGIEEVVTINITKQTSVPTQVGFGTLLCMAYHTVTTSLLTEYGSVKEMTDAGFPSTHPAVKMATIAFSQNPRPKSIMLGKRSLPFTQTIELYPTVTTQNFRYKFTVTSPSGTSWSIDYAVGASATVSSICTALAPLIANSNPDITATASATKITVACAAGKLFDLSSMPNPAHLKILDVTTDPGIATDLSAIEALDSSSWYGLSLDYAGKATSTATAAWVEARRKLCILDVSDSECVDNAVTSDLGSALKTSAYARTATIFCQNKLLSYAGVAWFGQRLTTTPGAANWAFVTLAGVPASLLTDGQKTILLGKKINTYAPLAGLNSTQNGFTSSGEFIDTTHGSDWLQARMQERIFITIKNASDAGRKIPYTDSGVDVLRAAGLAVLNEAVINGFLAADPPPTMSFPKVKDISPVDRANRTVPDGAFDGTLAGAVNSLTINGTLKV